MRAGMADQQIGSWCFQGGGFWVNRTPEQRGRTAAGPGTAKPSSTRCRGRNPFVPADPGCSSLSLLDPGLLSLIPAGNERSGGIDGDSGGQWVSQAPFSRTSLIVWFSQLEIGSLVAVESQPFATRSPDRCGMAQPPVAAPTTRETHAAWPEARRCLRFLRQTLSPN